MAKLYAKKQEKTEIVNKSFTDFQRHTEFLFIFQHTHTQAQTQLQF